MNPKSLSFAALVVVSSTPSVVALLSPVGVYSHKKSLPEKLSGVLTFNPNKPLPPRPSAANSRRLLPVSVVTGERAISPSTKNSCSYPGLAKFFNRHKTSDGIKPKTSLPALWTTVLSVFITSLARNACNIPSLAPT